jgi:hypothetical protein
VGPLAPEKSVAEKKYWGVGSRNPRFSKKGGIVLQNKIFASPQNKRFYYVDKFSNPIDFGHPPTPPGGSIVLAKFNLRAPLDPKEFFQSTQRTWVGTLLLLLTDFFNGNISDESPNFDLEDLRF